MNILGCLRAGFATALLLAHGQGLITPLAWIVRRRVDDLSL